MQVHERTVEIDFLLLTLKTLLQKRMRRLGQEREGEEERRYILCDVC
jgi:hypothetical protein